MSNYVPHSGSLGSSADGTPLNQGPGPKPDNYYGNARNPDQNTFTKTPNYIIVNTQLTTPVGFFFGPQTKFDNLASATAASNYTIMLNDDAVAGTRLNIHPTAWSGSAADSGAITFVYTGGLDGAGRP
tara:strand:+ start:468 stop:851 length:384 start_codon:yes stop_codon:yes gene_type:complete